MAKRTANDISEEVEKEEPKPKKKACNESAYSVNELAANAKKIFGTRKECVVAALKADGKTEYTVADAKQIIEKFLKQEVN